MLRSHRTLLTLPTLCAALLLGAITTPAQAARIEAFSPQGRVEEGTAQASARFDTEVVRLGDTQAAAPLIADCGGIAGQGRWSDARTWLWQLSRPLRAGERCRFELAPAFRDLKGAALQNPRRYEFQAAGPHPLRVRPAPRQPIEEDQAFVIETATPLRSESALAGLHCESDAVGERIPVQLIGEPERTALLTHLNIDKTDLDRALVFSCARRLPARSRMSLVWDAGIEAVSGGRSERAERFDYTVREPFTATMSCERERADAPCTPLATVTVQLSAEVALKDLLQARLLTPQGSRIAPRDPSQRQDERSDHASSLQFPSPLPADAELQLELPAGLKDLSGRPLSNAERFPLRFRTGPMPPLAKFPGRFGILELKEGGLLPVTVRHVEASLQLADLLLDASHSDSELIQLLQKLDRFEQQYREVEILRQDGSRDRVNDYHFARELSLLAGRSDVTRRELPRTGGTAPFEVIGIPLPTPGLHVVEIASQMLGSALLSGPRPMYVRSAALVTNLSVHLKRGRDSALVWVTTLDSGQPVADAEIRVTGCDGQEQWRGRSDAQGRAVIDRNLEMPRRCEGREFVLASARSGGDLSFVRSDWNEGIESWRFGIESWGDTSLVRFHTVVDRSLLRPGQKVGMKHLARRRQPTGAARFAVPAAEDLPVKLTLRHSDTGQEFSQPLEWSADGSAVSEWTIPTAARRGDYEILLVGGRGGMSTSGTLRVADFRLPIYTGSVAGQPARQVAPKTVPLALALSFLNGGPARQTPVSVSATLRPRWLHFNHYETYDFGLDTSVREAFGLGGELSERLVLDKLRLKLDDSGSGQTEVPLTEPVREAAELVAEMSFADPNGEIQTLRGTVELAPAELVIGLRNSQTQTTAGSETVTLVVLDRKGQPVAGQPVKLQGKRRIDYSHRRRIVGGFYAYDNHHEYVDLGTICKGVSDSRGQFDCVVPAQGKAGGVVALLAETQDAKGRTAIAGTGLWIGSGAESWFGGDNQDRIDVIPEQRDVRPGQTARLQVRMPFAEATALVTVEADGILDSRVMPLSRHDPVIELPVKAEWGPNAYVSVLVVRGRVQPLHWTSFFRWGWREPLAWWRDWRTPKEPTAMVDLARPAYRIGLASLQIGQSGFALDVGVTARPLATDPSDPASAEIYRPRGRAEVQVQVRLPDGSPAANAEVAFVAVDQALLELRPNESWNLLDALLPRRAHLVDTATAQSLVIGKRHFGKKAVAPGGGGGRGGSRELFDTLLMWQPRLRTDAQGRATLVVPLNDSLTEFRLVAVATQGADRFGTGSATVRTQQDLQLIAGLPPVVREGDRFEARLTVRNGSSRAMEVEVQAKAGAQTLEPRSISLAPQSAGEVSWRVSAPELQGADGATVEPITPDWAWSFEAVDRGQHNGGKTTRDRLRVSTRIQEATPATVQQTQFVRVEGTTTLPVTLPPGTLPGRGGIEVALSPRMSGQPPGLRRFFESYPYTCLEQKTSVAVGLNDPQRWKALVAELPALLDEAGLARYFPGDGPGHVVLTAYVLNMASLSGMALPDDLRQRMTAALQAFVDGRLRSAGGMTSAEEQMARKLIALEALTRQGLRPTTSAAALLGGIDPLRLSTAMLIDAWQVARRLPELPQREALMRSVEQTLRNRLDLATGRLGFTTERNDDQGWALMLNADTNALRLIEAMLEQPGWQEDLPRLMLGALRRQKDGRWATTTANAWAAMVLPRFGQRFEATPVSGRTHLQLGSSSAQRDWVSHQDSNSNDAPVQAQRLPWPKGTATPSDLSLSMRHEGTGKPWAHLAVLAALPPGSAPRAQGYRLKRTVTPLAPHKAGQTSRGDLWRVVLEIEADQPMSWVVVSDPIPGGARILGEGDGRDSDIAQRGEADAMSGTPPSYIERSFSSWQAYYEFLPRGRTRIAYTLRLNNVGEFTLPSSRVEAMYAPDLFAELPGQRVTVISNEP